ncbi:MAG: hypothetical protein KDA21_02755 [Phycisphaerales bacterium]|nr:hypothetical protein [Phycisphaerales bacterium]
MTTCRTISLAAVAGAILLTTAAPTALGGREIVPARFITDGAVTEANDPWSGMIVEPDDPNDPVVQAYIAERRMIRAAEREMKRLRARSFGSMRNVEIRQMGLLQIREWEDPMFWPSLLDVFGDEQEDVRGALLDIFENAASDAGDAALMWEAILNDNEANREQAFNRVRRRAAARSEADEDPIPTGSARILAHAIRYGAEDERTSAAHAIRALRILEAIPLLITGQISSGATASGTGGIPPEDKSLAWILIGRQTAYVADVTPVVGNGSVAFDPELGILTTGTILRIIDAAVITYHSEVHASLIDLTSEAWGQSTASLGYDLPAWRAWYEEQFLPDLAARREADAAAVPSETASS